MGGTGACACARSQGAAGRGLRPGQPAGRARARPGGVRRGGGRPDRAGTATAGPGGEMARRKENEGEGARSRMGSTRPGRHRGDGSTAMTGGAGEGLRAQARSPGHGHSLTRGGGEGWRRLVAGRGQRSRGRSDRGSAPARRGWPRPRSRAAHERGRVRRSGQRGGRRELTGPVGFGQRCSGRWSETTMKNDAGRRGRPPAGWRCGEEEAGRW